MGHTIEQRNVWLGVNFLKENNRRILLRQWTVSSLQSYAPRVAFAVMFQSFSK